MEKKGSKFKKIEKEINWEKILHDFKFQVKRSNKILKDFKSKEQLIQILNIHNKIFDLIPSGSVVKDIKFIDKFLKISNSIRENFFLIVAKELGRHLLNSLMFIHGVAQTYYATQWYHYFVYKFNKMRYDKLELIQVRNLTRLIRHFDFILLSAIEYVLKNYSEYFFEDVEIVENPKEDSRLIIKFINEFTKYFNELHTLNFFKFNNIKEVNLVFGPGLYYFQVQIEQTELLDYGNQRFELFMNHDDNYLNKSEKSYKNLEEDFLDLNNIWFEKFGYRINSIISTAQILGKQLNERYNSFLDPYNGEIPVFNIPDLTGKKIIDIRKIFENYLFQLISNYLNKQDLFNTLWTCEDIVNIIEDHRTDWRPNELKKILADLSVKPSSAFHLGENKLANHLFYPLDRFSLFFYIIGYVGALREHLNNKTSKIDDPLKEFILIKNIIRILEDFGFKIHPLSGKQIVDDNKITIGEIDLIATKDNEILLFIESKIIPQKKIDITKIRDFDQHMKNIRKKIKRFDKNLIYFKDYCGKKSTLDHFLNYNEGEILNTSNFKIVRNYFITPYLIFYPKGLLTNHTIEGLSVNLFDLRLKLLLNTL